MQKKSKDIGKITLQKFLNLPTRCQEIFFAYMETFKHNNAYEIFDVVPFSYPDSESPIETIFIFAFNIISYSKDETFFLYQQEETGVKGYRADFMFDSEWSIVSPIEYKNSLKLIVECDGHEFHEKTKEQVKHDNERDYELKKNGYEVLHFSGSQIYNNPFRCASDVYDFIKLKLGEGKLLYERN